MKLSSPDERGPEDGLELGQDRIQESRSQKDDLVVDVRPLRAAFSEEAGYGSG